VFVSARGQPMMPDTKIFCWAWVPLVKVVDVVDDVLNIDERQIGVVYVAGVVRVAAGLSSLFSLAVQSAKLCV